jgi:hypothetical protein
MDDKQQIAIKLSTSEAIVLFEFLSRFNNEGKLELVDQAEERVLWNICADLESVLAEPFMENYNEFLMEAREVVRDKTNE